MKSDWDVIIVGAGPAGAMTAMRLAAAGADVLVLDKARFPRDKPCGGGLTPKAYRQLDFDVGNLVKSDTDRVYLKGPHLAPIPISVPKTVGVRMVNRREFDARLVQVARERGAVVAEGEGVLRVETGALAQIETAHGTYSGRVVVGADGAESIIARQVGLRADRNRRLTAFALEAEARVARDVFDGAAYVDYRMPRGYGWVFPKGEIYNIGVGSGDPRTIRTLRAQLDRFIAETDLPLAEPVRVMGHRIPVWSHAEPLHRDNIVLAGDAAGLADALWGEGISYALMSGQIAAVTIADYFAGRIADFSVYTARIQGTLAHDLRRLYQVAHVVYGLPGLAFPVFAHWHWAQQVAAEIISGDRTFARVWRCACAADGTAASMGNCSPVLRAIPDGSGCV